MKHMKHFAIILAAAAGLLFLGACASSTPPPPKTVTVIPDAGSTATFVSLRAGDTLKIVLNGNPPQGGYAWVNAGVADSVVEQQGVAAFAPASRPGAQGTVTFTFVARRAGAQMLNLAYRRLNDRTTPLEKTYGVSVVVGE
jgi:predicted secreted protein